ncbi:MAG: AraC family transcriptional regulator [Phormidesmis sp.]
MKNPAIQQSAPHNHSCGPLQTQPWENIQVQQFQLPAGECNCICSDDLTLSLSLASRPVRMLQSQGEKVYSGLYGKGDITITPAKTPFSARWESDDNFLQIRLSDQLLQSVLEETLEQRPHQLELLPEFKVRSPQIDAIATLLLSELHCGHSASSLYIDSLANALAVNVLRHHAATTPRLTMYEGGLPQRQLMQVLDYMDAHLDRDIKLADLAQRLEMSQFHFSRLFKQSVGLSPYQYLMQQRIERAKRLLKKTDQLIVEIALACGFSSHSHLSKRFRQSTGVTPKAYRKGI